MLTKKLFSSTSCWVFFFIRKAIKTIYYFYIIKKDKLRFYFLFNLIRFKEKITKPFQKMVIYVINLLSKLYTNTVQIDRKKCDRKFYFCTLNYILQTKKERNYIDLFNFYVSTIRWKIFRFYCSIKIQVISLLWHWKP
jgi:hypothetical protein